MGILSKLFSGLLGPSVDYKEKIASGAIVVDVRTRSEFASGHAKNSKNIPLNELPKKVKKLKGKEVILVCRSGGRAAQAKSILSREGITAYNAGPWQRVR